MSDDIEPERKMESFEGTDFDGFIKELAKKRTRSVLDQATLRLHADLIEAEKISATQTAELEKTLKRLKKVNWMAASLQVLPEFEAKPEKNGGDYPKIERAPGFGFVEFVGSFCRKEFREQELEAMHAEFLAAHTESLAQGKPTRAWFQAKAMYIFLTWAVVKDVILWAVGLIPFKIGGSGD